MKRTIGVFPGDGPQVGTLHHNVQRTRERAAFEYAADWLTDAQGFPFGPTLPRVAGPQFHRKADNGSIFHGAIADTEPDGWGRRLILRDHLKRRQVKRQAGRGADV